MTLLKTSILSAISSGIKILTGLVVTKIIAIYLGPVGIALLGQFASLKTIVTAFSTGGIKNGIVKYISEYRDDATNRNNFLITSFLIGFIFSIISCIILVAFNEFFAEKVLHEKTYGYIFTIFGISIFFLTLNIILMSFLNGMGEIKKFIMINIASNFVGLIFTSIMSIYIGIEGALISYATGEAIVLIVTIVMILKSKWFSFDILKGEIEKDNITKLLKYTLMALFTLISLALTPIIIREYIGSYLSWEEAGYWQAVWRISQIYLMVFTMILSIYYVPKLSGLNDINDIKKEIKSGYKLLMPIVITIMLSIYFLREFIVELIFTKEFLPAITLFAFQLIGDTIRVASRLVDKLLIAKAKTRLFIFSELFFSLTFITFAIIGINYYGLIGVTYGYAFSFLLYFIWIMYMYNRNKLV